MSDTLQEKALKRLAVRGLGRDGGAAKDSAPDPFSAEASLRAANEDDDLYDPYSDYMDQLASSSQEELSEDPWR